MFHSFKKHDQKDMKSHDLYNDKGEHCVFHNKVTFYVEKWSMPFTVKG